VIIDVNSFLGHYPYRRIDGGSPAFLLDAMRRTGIDQAWVSNAAAIYWRHPADGNRILYQAATSHQVLRPVPAVHPGIPGWEDVLDEALDKGAPCVRSDPTFYGIAPVGAEMVELLAACGGRGLPVLMAARIEDVRQRHPNDGSRELDGAAIRSLVRSHPTVRLIITHADRDLIEQVHFGSTPEESGRILWDICWLWGPPEDQLTQLVKTVGAARFCFGTGMPLRIPESSVAKLELTEVSLTDRRAIESSNARAFVDRA
jgi:hypothetical protein